MKKTSSFLMAVALLLTMLVPMFAVGVVAEVPDGAVAYYKEGGETKYVYSLADAFAVGADASNTVTEINLVADKTITLKATEAITVNAAKSFTLKGNNCTLTEDGSFTSGVYLKIMGSSINTIVTLEGFNIKLGNAKANVHTLEVGNNNAENPITVILKNTVVEESRLSYATVVLRKSSKLIVDQGSSIINNSTAGVYDGRCYGVFITGNGTLEVKNGATVSGYTDVIAAIDPTATTSNIIIDGGTVESTSNKTIDTIGNVEINGGTVKSSGDTITSTGTLEVNGGTITGKVAVAVNGGTATIEDGTFIATYRSCVAVVNNGTSVTVNGGNFTTASKDLVLADGWGLITARYSGAIATVNGGNYYYPMAGKNGGGHVLQTINSAILVFNGGSVYATPNMVNNGSTGGNWHVRFNDFAIVKGASVRTVENEAGIRFSSTISAADISLANNITKKAGTTVTYGTVIAPYDFVQQVDVFTMAALDAADIKFDGKSVAADKKYVNIVAKDGIETDAAGNVTFRAALVNLDESNFARDFAAIPYISYQTDNGTVIIYGGFNAENNVRNMREIAYQALEDVKTSIETDYATKVETWYEYENDAWVEKTGTAYSCYSTAQLNVIKSYLPKNNSN